MRTTLLQGSEQCVPQQLQHGLLYQDTDRGKKQHDTKQKGTSWDHATFKAAEAAGDHIDLAKLIL